MARPNTYPSMWARLMACCVVDEATGCWMWTKALWHKYPKLNVRISGKVTTVRAHRVVGSIVARRKLDPVEETIEHRCKNQRCINPNHFLLATNVANATSGAAQRRGLSDSHVEMKVLWEDSGIFWHPTEAIPF